jgi:uncharacterized protein YaaN involved in tellurite resistance
VLTEDNVDLIITRVEDYSEDILQKHANMQETLYEHIKKELKDLQEAIYVSRAVSNAPSSLMIIELVDEPTQLRRLVNAKEARLHRVQEEKEKDT